MLFVVDHEAMVHRSWSGNLGTGLWLVIQGGVVAFLAWLTLRMVWSVITGEEQAKSLGMAALLALVTLSCTGLLWRSADDWLGAGDDFHRLRVTPGTLVLETAWDEAVVTLPVGEITAISASCDEFEGDDEGTTVWDYDWSVVVEAQGRSWSWAGGERQYTRGETRGVAVRATAEAAAALGLPEDRVHLRPCPIPE